MLKATVKVALLVLACSALAAQTKLPVGRIAFPSSCNTPGQPYAPGSAACVPLPAKSAVLTLNLDAPSGQDSGRYQTEIPIAGTIAMVSCSTDQGTIQINFEIRAAATPNSSGSAVMSGPLTCTSSTARTTDPGAPPITAGTLPASTPLAATFANPTGNPGIVRVYVNLVIPNS